VEVPALSRPTCDDLYELVRSPRWAALEGRTAADVAALLGRPDSVATLVHQGVTWTRITYVCETLPSRASDEERAAYAAGWRFTPSLLLRDGVVVPETTFDREVLGGGAVAVPPPELRFREGGRFP
jgi:hypothetical protein